MIRSILTLLNIKIFFLKYQFQMEKAATQPVEYALRFSSPGHLANKDFPLIPKDLLLYPRGRRVTAEAIKEICLLVISVLLISHLQQPNNRLECGIFV